MENFLAMKDPAKNFKHSGGSVVYLEVNKLNSTSESLLLSCHHGYNAMSCDDPLRSKFHVVVVLGSSFWWVKYGRACQGSAVQYRLDRNVLN